MHYRKLGRTGLKVSELCLGTMQWGWTRPTPSAFAVMDAFVEAGGNFIDTADVYSHWAEGNPGGVSEEIIGRWLKSHGKRHEIVLATKVRGAHVGGPNGEGLSRSHIIQACEDSLRRLQTDYIDLYQTHWYDAETPIEETMAALDTLVQQGKVRYVGCSNYPAWRLDAGALGQRLPIALRAMIQLQPHYNLANRAEYERELADVCHDVWRRRDPLQPVGRRLSHRQVSPGQCARQRARRWRKGSLFQRGRLADAGCVLTVAEEQGVSPIGRGAGLAAASSRPSPRPSSAPIRCAAQPVLGPLALCVQLAHWTPLCRPARPRLSARFCLVIRYQHFDESRESDRALAGNQLSPRRDAWSPTA